MSFFLFFFFNQKTAYEMRISDWSSDVCSSDLLGLLKTRAEPQADGSYAITGTKIFITAGEHDFTDNIVHLVLARLPDAPPGSKGISTFIVPKRKVGRDGSVGEDRQSTRLNSSHSCAPRMPPSPCPHNPPHTPTT